MDAPSAVPANVPVPPAVPVDVPVPPAPAALVLPAEAGTLDAERLLAYRVALELQALCSTLVPVGHRVLKDQLERASLSAVCNVAEGAGRYSRKEKRRFYAIARGSATETAAIVDVIRLRRLAPESACSGARTLAVRVVQLLTRLGAALG